MITTYVNGHKIMMKEPVDKELYNTLKKRAQEAYIPKRNVRWMITDGLTGESLGVYSEPIEESTARFFLMKHKINYSGKIRIEKMVKTYKYWHSESDGHIRLKLMHEK